MLYIVKTCNTFRIFKDKERAYKAHNENLTKFQNIDLSHKLCECKIYEFDEDKREFK